MSLTTKETDPTNNSASSPTILQVVSPGMLYIKTELFYPAPVVSAVSPTSIPKNATSTLVVTGSGFDVNGSLFYWVSPGAGTQPVSATLQSTTQATVSIPYPFTTTPGVCQLKVVNHSSSYTLMDPGGGTATFNVTVNA